VGNLWGSPTAGDSGQISYPRKEELQELGRLAGGGGFPGFKKKEGRRRSAMEWNNQQKRMERGKIEPGPKNEKSR